MLIYDMFDTGVYSETNYILSKLYNIPSPKDVVKENMTGDYTTIRDYLKSLHVSKRTIKCLKYIWFHTFEGSITVTHNKLYAIYYNITIHSRSWYVKVFLYNGEIHNSNSPAVRVYGHNNELVGKLFMTHGNLSDNGPISYQRYGEYTEEMYVKNEFLYYVYDRHGTRYKFMFLDKTMVSGSECVDAWRREYHETKRRPFPNLIRVGLNWSITYTPSWESS